MAGDLPPPSPFILENNRKFSNDESANTLFYEKKTNNSTETASARLGYVLDFVQNQSICNTDKKNLWFQKKNLFFYDNNAIFYIDNTRVCNICLCV